MRKTFGLYALTPVITVFTGVALQDGDRRDRDRRLRFLFSIMDTRTNGYPEGFDFGSGWQDDGEGWATAEVMVERGDDLQFDVVSAMEPLRSLGGQLRQFRTVAISAL